MCGIFSVYGISVTPKQIHEGLKKLQYRGYDSWGLGVAKEFTLKLQEVAYIKASSTTGYEMKHGPIALIDEKSKVFYFGPPDTNIPMILESRGAKIVHSSEHNSFMRMLCDIVTIQLVTYYTALNKNLPIDTPRNLAKSVTV